VNHSCYLCDLILTGANVSEEHIIPNSIGGRLTSNNLLCKNCNEKTGTMFDDIFSKYGNFLASKYNIKRDRGDVPNFIAVDKKTGAQLVITPGFNSGHLHPYYPDPNDRLSFSVFSKKRAKEEMEKIMAERGINSEEYQVELKREVTPNGSEFVREIHLNTDLFFRSVSKIFSNFFIYSGREKDQIQLLVNFIKTDAENRFTWFLNLDASKQFHESKPYHILIIKGDRKSKYLIGYFEMFGEMGFICLLNGKYSGDDIDISYTYDPVNRSEVEYVYKFNLPISVVTDVLSKKRLPDKVSFTM
jgi:hypothetical protein